MMELFTVDRSGGLYEGMVCELVGDSEIKHADIAAHVKEMYPDGLSFHGLGYLLGTYRDSPVVDVELEMFFDLVRRLRYPDAPSRYQCIFAVDSLDAAMRMAEKLNAQAPRVFKLQSEKAIRVDMRLLRSDNLPLAKYYLADLYWAGKTPADGAPIWEWLVPCPVVIGTRVA